jgi:excisionase family DNA binding protein
MHIYNMQKAELIALIKGAVKEALNVSEISNPENPNDKLITIAELAAHLKVTKPTIYNWRNKKYIHPRKIGGRVLYNLKEVNDFIESHSALFGNGRRYGCNYNAAWDKRSQQKATEE